MAIYLPIYKIKSYDEQHYYLVGAADSDQRFIMMIDPSSKQLVFFEPSDMNFPLHSIMINSDQELGKLPGRLNDFFPIAVKAGYKALMSNNFPDDISICS